MRSRTMIVAAAVLALALALVACDMRGKPPEQPEESAAVPTPTETEVPPTPTEEPATQEAAAEEQTSEPEPEPTEEPTAEPTAEPTVEPTEEQPAEPPAGDEGGGESPPPAEPVVIEPSGDAAAAIAEAWMAAYELPPGVPFSVTLTEAQIESMIDEKIAEYGYGQNATDIDVMLKNGQVGVSFNLVITVSAMGKSRDVNATATAVFAVSVGGNGDIVVSVVSAEASGAAGSVGIPPEMLAVFNEALAAAISGAEVSAQAGVDVTFTEVVIKNGTITVSGYVTPL